MPEGSSISALSLAGQLRNLDDDSLAALISVRGVRDSAIKDFFDLAEALLARTSIQQALARLERPALIAVSVIGQLSSSSGPPTRADVAAHLDALGVDSGQLDAHLADTLRLALLATEAGHYAAYEAVIEQLAAWPSFGLPTFEELITTAAPAALEPVSVVDSGLTDGVAAERAFATTSAIAELVGALEQEAARELARGGIALPDSKRLAAAMGVELEEVPAILSIAARASLVELDAGQWTPTADTAEWLTRSSPDRWSRPSGAWLERLPTDIRRLLAERAHAVWGERLEEYVEWLFPAGGDWTREQVSIYTRDAELLGISADHAPSTPGVRLLTEGAAEAARAMAELFPAEVDKVYLQHDLSVVSPGPLLPGIDARLRSLADLESRALASSYRISGASLNRAMVGGETAESLREFLASISLTGIPQPLDYLISETANRHGLLRVGSVDGSLADPAGPERGARSYIRSEDTALLATLVVDQNLTVLGLTRSGKNRVVSRFERDIVFWSLSEAKYPVAAEDADEQVIALRRKSVPRQRATVQDPVRALIERLRLGSPDADEHTGQAWLARQLDLAIKNKLALTVTVLLPDGSTADYQLEPAGLAGGRLRARDRRSDIERTLPLSSITAIGPAAPAP